MKIQIAVLAALISASASAVGLKGSDTLAGLMTDAIVASGLDGQVSYLGTGSGNGEKALLAGEQGLAPMSRALKPEVLAEIKAKGLTVVEHKVALDAIAMLAKDQGGLPVQLDLETIKAIYTCKITDWASVPGSSKTGAIRVLRRDDASGTTDAFKFFTGIKEFGACVTALESTDELAVETSNDASALAYAGLSGKRPGNKILPLFSSANGRTSPTVVNIRSFKYPFARFLYVYEVTEKLTSAEKSLMDKVADRTFLDPIVQNNGFITVD
jgi:phosphate transport system substrate-binding protein